MWANSQKFILVKRSKTGGLKPYQETAYYLSSRQENAKVFDKKIRGHWRM
jgi:predicted transposase YbfD/YdcC